MITFLEEIWKRVFVKEIDNEWVMKNIIIIVWEVGGE
jgi:predicted nucleic acid binding AN1-type Zn finger protein